PNVTEWLLKNGYSFSEGTGKEKYNNFAAYPEDYEQISVNNLDSINDKDLFLFKKSALEEEPLRSMMSAFPDGSKYIEVRLKEMHQLPGLIRFGLEKSL
ncbi:MAG: hypothetical protein M3Q64_02760, partial [bacterium]|nr:hypothetical protein [bacterium]